MPSPSLKTIHELHLAEAPEASLEGPVAIGPVTAALCRGRTPLWEIGGNNIVK